MAETSGPARTGATDTKAAPRPVPGWQHGVRIAYRWALALFLLMGVVQIFLAGLGVFSLHGRELEADGGAFDPHRSMGFTMAGVALVILVLALIGRVGVRSTVLAAVVLVLAALAQSLLAGLADHGAFWGGLHAFDGLLIIGLAGYQFGSASRATTP